MPTSQHKRAKSWGYECEILALRILQRLYPGMRRTGSLAYKRDAADLVDDGVHVQVKGRSTSWIGTVFKAAEKVAGPGTAVYLVTKAKGASEPLLVTMRLDSYVNERIADRAKQ